MRTTYRRAIALLLALVLALSLCACARMELDKDDKPARRPGKVDSPKDQNKLTNKERDEDPAADGDPDDRLPHNGDPDDTDTPPAQYTGTEEGQQSLFWLRDKIDVPDVMFGMAYLGYVGGLFDEGFEAGFPAWLWETNSAMLRKYPFIAEIDAEHILGGAGHLYCIVPVDENATVAINRVEWNAATQSQEVTEVLYRSESGEPVLLFANLDGVAYEDDTQVIITDNDGNTCQWNPSLDAMSILAPCVSETGAYHSWDFTEYTWQSGPEGLGDWFADGWNGPTALGLAGSEGWDNSWCVHSMVRDTDKYGFFTLTFYPGDETGGTVDLDWSYEGQEDLVEQWSGFWTIETAIDMPSYVTIELSLVGGSAYDSYDGPAFICETYPVLISPSGEELMIAAGANGICLPFLSQSTLSVVLMRAYG